jgi:hypothetical protein
LLLAASLSERVRIYNKEMELNIEYRMFLKYCKKDPQTEINTHLWPRERRVLGAPFQGDKAARA